MKRELHTFCINMKTDLCARKDTHKKNFILINKSLYTARSIYMKRNTSKCMKRNTCASTISTPLLDREFLYKWRKSYVYKWEESYIYKWKQTYIYKWKETYIYFYIHEMYMKRDAQKTCMYMNENICVSRVLFISKTLIYVHQNYTRKIYIYMKQSICVSRDLYILIYVGLVTCGFINGKENICVVRDLYISKTLIYTHQKYTRKVYICISMNTPPRSRYFLYE
jgi:hypothetical protein